MKNVIELARLAKEVYRATNELLQIVVNIKSKTKKAKTLEEVKKNTSNCEKDLRHAAIRINDAVLHLIDWSNN